MNATRAAYAVGGPPFNRSTRSAGHAGQLHGANQLKIVMATPARVEMNPELGRIDGLDAGEGVPVSVPSAGHRAAVIVSGSRLCGSCFLSYTLKRIMSAKEMFSAAAASR